MASDAAALKEKKIGVIGLGMVGNALVKNLKREGYNVTSILDTDTSKYSEFTSFSSPAENPKQLAEAVDVVFTALPMPPHVKAVFEGDTGLLAGLGGKVWVDHSTTDYEQTEEMNAQVVEAGGKMLEAPVTGGLEALRKGQMTVFLAGEKPLADEYMPLMESIYCNVIYTGKMGTALIPKVLSNMLTCVHNLRCRLFPCRCRCRCLPGRGATLPLATLVAVSTSAKTGVLCVPQLPRIPRIPRIQPIRLLHLPRVHSVPPAPLVA